MIRLTLPILTLFIAACASLAGVEPIKVQGDAMLPALKDGELILLDRNIEKLVRGDIVISTRSISQLHQAHRCIAG